MSCKWKDCEKKSLKSSQYCGNHKKMNEMEERDKKREVEKQQEEQERKQALDAVLEPRELNYKSLYKMSNRPESLPKLFIPKEKKEEEDVITAVDKMCRKALESYFMTSGCVPGTFTEMRFFPSQCRGFSFEELSEEFKKRGYDCFRRDKMIIAKMTQNAFFDAFE